MDINDRTTGRRERKNNTNLDGLDAPFLDIQLDASPLKMTPGYIVDTSGSIRNTYNQLQYISTISTAASAIQTAVEGIEQDGLYNEGANGDTPSSAWNAFYKDITLVAGAAANQELVASVTGKKIDAIVYIQLKQIGQTNAGVQRIEFTFQDEDDTAVTPAVAPSIMYVYDSGGNWGQFGQMRTGGAFRFQTPTAAKALEVDVASSIAGAVDKVTVYGLWRELD